MNSMAKHLPECDMPIDTGIAYAVAVLRSGGVETFESCEGTKGHCFLEPTVRFAGNSGAGFRALSIAIDYGLPVADLRRAWRMIDGELTGPDWEMTFYETCPMPDAAPREKDESRALGGHARAAKLTAERRSDIARQAANARWRNPESNPGVETGSDT